MKENNLQNPAHRASDLWFGIVFILLGGFRFYTAYTGVEISKVRLFISAAIIVWGSFKLYAYFKTKP